MISLFSQHLYEERYNYAHFMDKKTGLERVSNVPEMTQWTGTQGASDQYIPRTTPFPICWCPRALSNQLRNNHTAHDSVKVFLELSSVSIRECCLWGPFRGLPQNKRTVHTCVGLQFGKTASRLTVGDNRLPTQGN